MKNKVLSLLLALSFLTSYAFAEVSVSVGKAKRNTTTQLTSSTPDAQTTTINILGVPQTYFDGAVTTLDETYVAATGGTIDGVTIGGITPAPLQFLTPTQIINSTGPAATGGTVNAVTLAKSGYMYILTAPAATQAYPGGVGMTLSLPSTNSTVGGSFTGQTYTFTTATGSTLSIRCASATDATIFYGTVNTTRITSPASSGSTVTLVGVGGSWYIASMSGGKSNGTSPGDWVTGTA